MTINSIPHLSTSTPASEVSSADFYRNEGADTSGTDMPSMADILRNSPAKALLGIKDEDLETEDTEEAPDQGSEEVSEDPGTSDDPENETTEESDGEESTEEEDSKESTPEGDLPTEEEIEWSYKIPVKVDGKLEYKTLEEVRKGYQTDQHLSNEGRKIGEMRKQLEAERNEKLQEVVDMGSQLHAELTSTEATYQKQYGDLTKAIEDARDSGDTYKIRELKEQREDIQEKYWEARNKREETAKKITDHYRKLNEENQTRLLEQFNKDIQEKVPGFDGKLSKSIRDFALKEGIPETMLDTVFDASVVKFINDYRKLKQAKEIGQSKRKVAPTSKSVPLKKGTPQSKKEADAIQSNRAKVLSGNGDNRDQLEFIKRISSISRKL
jgi:hypothetical protein